MSKNAPDFFGNGSAQGDLFAGREPEQPKPNYRPNPDDVRREPLERLQDAREAEDGSPWPYEEMRYKRVVFPQMANWLPVEERDRLRLQFRAELERLNLLA